MTTIQVIEAYIIVTLFFYAINIANIVSETGQEKTQVPLTGTREFCQVKMEIWWSGGQVNIASESVSTCSSNPV